MLFVCNINMLYKIILKFPLSFLLFFIIAAVLVSFKLPELNNYDFFSTSKSEVIRIDFKTEKIETDYLKFDEHQKSQLTDTVTAQYFSNNQLLAINALTFVLIIVIFVIRTKYFD